MSQRAVRERFELHFPERNKRITYYGKDLASHVAVSPDNQLVAFTTATIIADFKNNGVQSAAYPPDRSVLFRHVGAGVEIVRVCPYLLSLFEANRAFRPILVSEPCTEIG